MRMLRPFAIIPRMKRVRQALESLWNARYHISRVSVLIFLMTFASGVIGLEMFSGRMRYCTALHAEYKRECTGPYLTPALDEELGVLAWDHHKHHSPPAAENLILAPRSWHRSHVNFDDFPNVLRVVLIVALPPSAGWAKIAEDAVRVRGDGDMAMRASGTGFAPVLLFGACVMVLHLMLQNLLIAVLIRFLRETNGLAMLTSAQKAWQTTQRLIKRSASIMDDNSSSAAAAGLVVLQPLVQADLFGFSFDLLILLNCIVLGLPSALASDGDSASMQQFVNTGLPACLPAGRPACLSVCLSGWLADS